MQPPRFWYSAEGRDRALALQALLTPVSWLYAGVAAAKLARPATAPATPTLCVGNLTLGGAGKTPVVRALRAMLKAQGVEAHVVSRGYGGSLAGPVRVSDAHTAADVGDEPLLHARDGPAWIARDRAAGVAAAAAAGARMVVLDDGHQNPDVAKTASLLVFDARRGVGNGRVFPAGPLREPMRAGLRRAAGVVLMRSTGDGGETDARLTEGLRGFAGPVIEARLEPRAPAPPGRLFPFAGIGDPERFFATIAAAGGEIVGRSAFPDHHAYDGHDLRNLHDSANHLHAALITTEKDHVRLPPDWRARIAHFDVTARFADEAAIMALLAPFIASAR